jgi:hypothetical protein
MQFIPIRMIYLQFLWLLLMLIFYATEPPASADHTQNGKLCAFLTMNFYKADFGDSG